MKATCMLLQLFLVCGWAWVLGEAYGTRGFDPLENLMRAKWFKKEGGAAIDTSSWGSFGLEESKGYDPVYVGHQDGLMEADKIDGLPGQPAGVKFDQYAGYVTVDPGHGRALFYYFAEAPVEPSTKPLVLWLNGGPGCSSFGNGAMMELGPFRVKSDGKTLYQNPHAWNNVANIIFLESPAGVGFSYSNTTSDYNLSGDKRTAEDSYAFLINWLERFPQYKTRDFYITGESYAGHYVPQLAQKILQNNKIANQTVINLRGIAIGNAWIDDETGYKGMYDFLWTHALTSDEIHEGISLNCNFSSTSLSEACITYLNQADLCTGSIYIYNIYFPLCTTSSSPPTDGGFDPCSENYIYSYLNLPQVQKALHANVTGLPNAWNSCSVEINAIWKDSPTTLLPVIQELMKSNIRVWIYSGDVDGQVPVTSSRYSISTFNASVKTPWYPWYSQEEVGGYAVEYQGLAFVTVRDAGHLVPSYQPARALTLFSSFIKGKLPPRN